MVCTLRRDLDPLDWEIVERAVQGVSEIARAGQPPADLDSDEDLERALRRELAEMIHASGVGDADVLLDILITGMSGKIKANAAAPRPTDELRPVSAETAAEPDKVA